MSSTNKTTYYELPLFIGTDIPTWLGDFNGAMSDIDIALKSNADRADLASQNATNAVNTANAAASAVGSLETAVTGLADRVSACEQTDEAQSSQISSLNNATASLGDRVTALEQSGGGGAIRSYGISKVNIGSYSGNIENFNANTVLTAMSVADIESYRVLGIVVDITIGNAHGQSFIPFSSNGALSNGFATTVELMGRVYAGSAVSKYTIQLDVGNQTGTSRALRYVSSIRETFQTPSGSSSGSTSGTASYFNENGVSGSGTITVNFTALVMDINQ